MRNPVTITLDKDAFGYLPLGALATYVYLLVNPGAPPAEIAKATRRSVATVYRSMKPLRDAGLITRRSIYSIQASDLQEQGRAA